jgi:hypothetical protein
MLQISQIFVEEFTLQFLNLYGCEMIIRLSLFAEWIGVCNFSWLLYGVMSRIICRKVRIAQKSLDSTKSNSSSLTDFVVDSSENGHMKETDINKRNKLPRQNSADESDHEMMSPTTKIRGPNYNSGIPKFMENLGIFDIFKYLWSTGVTLGSLAVICYGISIGAYVLPTPVAAAYIIAIFTMCILFYLEGLMIAIVGTQ